MSVEALPILPAPLCEWEPNKDAPRCGAPATEMLIMHDTRSPDPTAQRVRLLCNPCLSRLLEWARTHSDKAQGPYCTGCKRRIRPVLGAVIIAHGELAKPDQDVRYDR